MYLLDDLFCFACGSLYLFLLPLRCYIVIREDRAAILVDAYPLPVIVIENVHILVWEGLGCPPYTADCDTLKINR